MGVQYEVTRATLLDLDGLTPLFCAYLAFYGRGQDAATCRRFMEERLRLLDSIILVSGVGDETVGFAQLYPSFSSIRMAPIFILNDLYVAPAARRSGAADRLLQASEDAARASGGAAMSLMTGRGNGPAQALYRHRGWVQDGEFITFDLDLGRSA